MSATRTTSSSNPALAETVRALSRIARELEEISQRLSTRVEGGSPEAEVLSRSGEELAHLSQALDNLQAQETGAAAQAEELARLRREILENLLRKGPALPIELAAATLSLPEEVQPVLEEMEREGLIAIEELESGRLITITARGRAEAQR